MLACKLHNQTLVLGDNDTQWQMKFAIGCNASLLWTITIKMCRTQCLSKKTDTAYFLNSSVWLKTLIYIRRITQKAKSLHQKIY